VKIHYNEFLALRRPPYLQGNGQFAKRGVLDMAERILYNLQKGIVDNTISKAAGLEKGNSYPATYQALPFYQFPSHVPIYISQNSSDTGEISNNY
jgi:hypothetical protein